MLKGCQREMILLQTEDSPLFECAYLLLRHGCAAERPAADMVTEAERIIGAGGGVTRKRKRRRSLPFTAGFVAGAAAVLTIAAILRIFL